VIEIYGFISGGEILFCVFGRPSFSPWLIGTWPPSWIAILQRAWG